MFDNSNLQTPPKINITDSTIYGIWEVVQISPCNENSEPISVTGITKYHFLEEMLFIRVKEGVSSQGMWKLSDTNEGNFRYSIILDEQTELGIIYMDTYELILSDGCIDYKMIRRI